MQQQTSGVDHKMVLLDPTLLADLHRAGWRGAVSSNADFTVGVAEPIHPERYGPGARATLESALKIPTLQHLPLSDITLLEDLRSLEKYLSYEERLLLALARSSGCHVAAQEKPMIQQAEKLLGKTRVLSRASLVASAGLQFEAQAPQETGESEASELWKLWGTVGQTATERARAELHAQGIGYVVKRDGVVVEALPDGTILRLAETKRPESN